MRSQKHPQRTDPNKTRKLKMGMNSKEKKRKDEMLISTLQIYKVACKGIQFSTCQKFPKQEQAGTQQKPFREHKSLVWKMWPYN